MTKVYTTIEDIPSFEDTEYKETCACGNVLECTTQQDNCPEYHTDVYIKCQKCGSYVEFTLPVN